MPRTDQENQRAKRRRGMDLVTEFLCGDILHVCWPYVYVYVYAHSVFSLFDGVRKVHLNTQLLQVV